MARTGQIGESMPDLSDFAIGITRKSAVDATGELTHPAVPIPSTQTGSLIRAEKFWECENKCKLCVCAPPSSTATLEVLGFQMVGEQTSD